MAEPAETQDKQPAARADVLTALRQHGLAGVVAAALWSAARDLRQRTRRRGIEHAITLDIETAQAVSPMLTGTPTSTDLSPHLRVMQAGRTYVVLHTHPRSTSFSDLDIRILSDHERIRVMIAVGSDGTWHILSRQYDPEVAHNRTVEIDFLRTLAAPVDASVPPAERIHGAMEKAAVRHGWQYDRVTGESSGRENL
ncbi:MAG: hypothetical protein IT306_11010 [Chloroflexi bacterium]|nr:hypothetical protein [Chloroflexota bacterium]